MTGEDDVETIDNTERYCGYLKQDTCYLRGETSADGTLPPIVTFDPPVPYLEGHFRGYKQFPGVQFEQRQTPTIRDYDAGMPVEGDEYAYPAVPEGALDPAAARDHTQILDSLSNVEMDLAAGGFTTDPPLEINRHLRRLETDAEGGGDGGSHLGEMRVARAHDLLMHVGKSYYHEPQDFIEECRAQGLSKAIPVSEHQQPPVINPGRTRVFLIHPRACPAGHDEDGNPVYTAGLIGYCYVTRCVYTGVDTGAGTDWPEFAKQYAENGLCDLVKIGERVSKASEENGALDEYGPDSDE
jgi:hypothetical protein